MGLFSWLGDRVSDAVSWVGDRVSDAVSWVDDRIDDIKDFFGGSSSYTGSVLEKVNVEKALSDFKEEVSAKLKVIETALINYATEVFDGVIQDLQKDFPDFVESTIRQKNSAIHSLRGIMDNYVSKHVSENDPELLSILKMQPGTAKKDAFGKRINAICSEAEKNFYIELKKTVNRLNKELASNFEKMLAEKENLIENEQRKLATIATEAEAGTLDVELHIQESEPAIETADYILHFLPELGDL